MNNILITSVSRKVSLIKNFKKALNGEGNVIAIDIDIKSPALYFADEYLLSPRSDSPEFIGFILDLCKKFTIDLIIPTRDEDLVLFSKNSEFFEDIGTKVMASSPETIDICQDKNKFIDFCIENDFNIPLTFFDRETIKETDFPLFLKPTIGKGGLNTFKVESFDELDLILSLDEDFIIQEAVEYSEYTIDLFADFEGNVISAVPRKRISVWGGESLVTKTFKNEKLINETIRLAETLNLIGHNTIQCFFDGENIKFIEVNPRFGGAASISFKVGANSAEFLIKLMNEEKLEPIIGEFEDNLIALRYVEDFFINEDSIGDK